MSVTDADFAVARNGYPAADRRCARSGGRVARPKTEMPCVRAFFVGRPVAPFSFSWWTRPGASSG